MPCGGFASLCTTVRGFGVASNGRAVLGGGFVADGCAKATGGKMILRGGEAGYGSTIRRNGFVSRARAKAKRCLAKQRLGVEGQTTAGLRHGASE